MQNGVLGNFGLSVRFWTFGVVIPLIKIAKKGYFVKLDWCLLIKALCLSCLLS